MRFAMIGCGYIADSYLKTLANHPQLQLAGVFDRDPARLRQFQEFYGVPSYSSFQEALNDSNVELIANLTNPASHYAITKAALEAGKHVYSEKPLAAEFSQAKELVELAEKNGVLLASAPCNLLSESAQTLWKALREGRIGTPRLAYAELDTDFAFTKYDTWINESGACWPFKDEFETGCTLEHAAYYLGWLTAFFGPAKQITSSAGVMLEKNLARVDRQAPAFTLACIEFASGMIARITCSMYTSNNLSLRIFGDAGVLETADCWDYASPVYCERRPPVTWRERHPRRASALGLRPRLPFVRPSAFAYDQRHLRMDFARGIAELADALAERREPRLSARWSLHVTELVLAMNIGDGVRHKMSTTFQAIAPMPWAS